MASSSSTTPNRLLLAIQFVFAVTIAVTFAVPSSSPSPSLFNTAPSTLDVAATNSITWGSCTQGFDLKIPSGLDIHCARLSVPLNWDKPHDQQISLGMVKLPAKNQAHKLGSLVFNPGGPGGRATEWLTIGWFSDKLRENYDIIGPDPRGIGASTPLVCDHHIFNERVSIFPQDAAAFDKLVDKSRRFSESCVRMTGNDLLYHMDTASAARDLDAIRKALGHEKLDYLGYSYGTELGARYAELFPHRVGRMALDGVVDHNLLEVPGLKAMSLTLDASLRRFFDWCRQDEACALHGQDVASIYKKLSAKADTETLPAPGCHETCHGSVTGDSFRRSVQGMLCFKDVVAPLASIVPSWKQLGHALKNATQGDATAFAGVRIPDGTSPALASSNWGFWTVGCLDYWHNSTSVEELKMKQKILEDVAPLTRGSGEFWDWSSFCLGWPVAPEHIPNPPHPANVRDAPPMLLVSSKYDPVCSVEWGFGQHAQIEKSVFVIRLGDGHTSYMVGGETSKAIDGFLMDGVLPKQGTSYET